MVIKNSTLFSNMPVMYANTLYKRDFIEECFKVICTFYEHCNNFEVSRIYPRIPKYINEKNIYLRKIIFYAELLDNNSRLRNWIWKLELYSL